MLSNQNLDDNIKRVPTTYSGAEAEDALANSLEGSFRVEVSTGINYELFLALGSFIGYAMIMQFVPEEGGRVQVAVGPDGRSSTRTHNGGSWGNWFVGGFYSYRELSPDFVNNHKHTHNWTGIVAGADNLELIGLERDVSGSMILNIADSYFPYIPEGSYGHSVQLAFRHGRDKICYRFSTSVGWGNWATLMNSESADLIGDLKAWSEDKSVYDIILRHKPFIRNDGVYVGSAVCLRAGQGLILGSGENVNGLYQQLTAEGIPAENIYMCSDQGIAIYYGQNEGLDLTKLINITANGEVVLSGVPTHSRAAVPKSYVDTLEARVKALEDKLK